MSQKNVETVRSFYEALERSWEAYWRNPRRIAEALEADDLAPEGAEAMAFFDPDAVWNAGGFGTFHGVPEMLATFDDILEVADYYSVTLNELVKGKGGRVFASVDRTLEAKGSGIRAKIPAFTVITLKKGLIRRLDEYLDRQEALAAAGLASSWAT